MSIRLWIATLILVAGVVAAQPRAAAQSDGRTPIVGILTQGESDATPYWNAFRAALRDVGRIEGRNIRLEFGLARGEPDRLSAQVAALVALPADVIVTVGVVATRAAAAATRTIPIVQATGGDLAAIGLVASHAHPGGNVTGFTILAAELGAKRVQVLREAFPGVQRIAVLVNRTSNPGRLVTAEAARALELRLLPVVARTPAELRALQPAAFDGADALVVISDNMFWHHRAEIVALARATRLPAMYPETEYVSAGGLMSYAPDTVDDFRRVAGYVDRILKGEKPANLPVQEPTRFLLTVNMKTAQALGFAIPPAFLARADEVIE